VQKLTWKLTRVLLGRITVLLHRCGLLLPTEYRGLSVCPSVTLVSPAKTAAPIEMPFGLRTRVGPRNHIFDGGPYHPWEEAIMGGKVHPTVKYRDTAVTCAKTAEPIEMPFGLWARIGRRNHVLDGV